MTLFIVPDRPRYVTPKFRYIIDNHNSLLPHEIEARVCSSRREPLLPATPVAACKGPRRCRCNRATNDAPETTSPAQRPSSRGCAAVRVRVAPAPTAGRAQEIQHATDHPVLSPRCCPAFCAVGKPLERPAAAVCVAQATTCTQEPVPWLAFRCRPLQVLPFAASTQCHCVHAPTLPTAAPPAVPFDRRWQPFLSQMQRWQWPGIFPLCSCLQLLAVTRLGSTVARTSASGFPFCYRIGRSVSCLAAKGRLWCCRWWHRFGTHACDAALELQQHTVRDLPILLASKRQCSASPINPVQDYAVHL